LVNFSRFQERRRERLGSILHFNLDRITARMQRTIHPSGDHFNIQWWKRFAVRDNGRRLHWDWRRSSYRNMLLRVCSGKVSRRIAYLVWFGGLRGLDLINRNIS